MACSCGPARLVDARNFDRSVKSCVMRFTRLYSVLPRPNLDLKSIIKNADSYRDSIIKREAPQLLEKLDFIVQQRPRELELTNQANRLKHTRASISKTITKENKLEVVEQLGKIKAEVKALETAITSLSSEIIDAAESLPNLIDESVSNKETVVEYINCESAPIPADDKSNEVFDHKTIAERKGLIEFDQASKVSGSSWYYLLGDGALLENALVQYALASAIKKGYTYVIPPTIVKNDIINACGFKPRDQNNEQQIYEVAGSDSSLIGTSEIPLAALHANAKFDPTEQFPKKYVGLSRAFRAEAGARGRDTKGLYRVHEFTKLELFHFTKPELSSQELNELVEFQKEIITNLGLTAKIINIPYNDLGAPAFKKFDIEAWMPGRNQWGELTSSSNCTDYQARRMNIRFFNKDKSLGYVHTLNGTAVAVPRVIVAIIEQNYDPETNRIKIPDVLVPFIGKEYL